MNWFKRWLGYRELTDDEQLLLAMQNARRRLASSARIPAHEQRAANNLIGRIQAMEKRLESEWGL